MTGIDTALELGDTEEQDMTLINVLGHQVHVAP